MNSTEHKPPSLADQVAGKIKRGIGEIVGSHELQQEGVAQEYEGNAARAEDAARAAVEGLSSSRPKGTADPDKG